MLKFVYNLKFVYKFLELRNLYTNLYSEPKKKLIKEKTYQGAGGKMINLVIREQTYQAKD